MKRSRPWLGLALSGAAFLVNALGQNKPLLPRVTEVDAQPLAVHALRLADALEFVGRALSSEEKAKLVDAKKNQDDANTRAAIQDALDPHCLAYVNINPESRVKVQVGPAKRELVEQGWTSFLVKVHNEAGVTAALEVKSPQAERLFNSPADQVRDRWLDLQVFRGQPLQPALSGVGLEYVLVQLYSRDAGKRSAVLEFSVGQGTQDLGFRSDLFVTFDCRASHPLTLEVMDENGKPTMASFEIRDPMGRVYPSMAKRLAPDFAFHPQIYRASGESVALPEGKFTVICRRGPEYVSETRSLTMTSSATKESFKLKRWIDPSLAGWWSGDHHIHAAGCAHYTNPTEGVHAPDMMRHCLGEDLKIGANLTWGPCFDYQKQFFTGKDDKVSQYPYLLRYDVEVSGFGSHNSGHLCLLRLKEQMYPGGDSKHHWPTLCLNTLRWAQKQGAVCGPAHSGWGLKISEPKAISYELPPFDGIGACEYIVDVTHMVEGPDGQPVPAVDFISTVDTPFPYELNVWYHTLNAGYRTRISGETDFPCIYGERVGLGRSYVKQPGKLNYDDWCQGVSEGRCYVSDGFSHLMDFEVNGVQLASGKPDLKLDASGAITAKVKVAAMLDEKADEEIRRRPVDHQPYWHIERARREGTREVSVELLVNGHAVATQNVLADGSQRDLTFTVPLNHSGWISARILPSSHTNPIFVEVAGKPIRERRSIDWCMKSVENCWREKEKHIKANEMQDAIAAYNHARAAYKQRLAEAEVD